jgi:hypothetical protein
MEDESGEVGPLRRKDLQPGEGIYHPGGGEEKRRCLAIEIYKEPMPDGPEKGAVLNREKIDTLLDEYYVLRGWDKITGIPTREKLSALGLDYVVEDLLRRRIIHR